MSGGNREAGRSVTDKVLSVLTAFESQHRPLALTEIAAIAGIPVSTAHRLVGELTEWQLISRTANGRYQLGLRVWELAQNVGRQLRDTAKPFVQELFSLTQETSHIAIRDGNEVLYIERIYDTRRVPQSTRVGGRLPMHNTAVGKVLLAYEEPWVRSAYLDLDLVRATERTITDARALAAELDRTRGRGFATTYGEQSVDTCSIAVPVFHTGRIGAALGIVVPIARSDSLVRHLPVLKAISARIESATARIPLESLLRAHQVGGDPAPPEV
ncbi:IclR family transcriptional regulator [Arthrobacter sp. 2MCAF14]|uniref:IclR family transcriptional regulator n=1 Tax=Arthrobacter sp. 2MCAF14 TaxID=3232982 RepID=UPI003F93BE2F